MYKDTNHFILLLMNVLAFDVRELRSCNDSTVLWKLSVGEVKFGKRKVLRQKSKTRVWSKTKLKTELDLATKTGSKNILRLNFGLRLLP